MSAPSADARARKASAYAASRGVTFPAAALNQRADGSNCGATSEYEIEEMVT